MPDLTGYRFTSTHEWVHLEAGMATIGISDHAQAQLGDVIFLELPEVGSVLQAGARFGAVESVKAASDIFAPVTGTVLEVKLGPSHQSRGRQPLPVRGRLARAPWRCRGGRGRADGCVRIPCRERVMPAGVDVSDWSRSGLEKMGRRTWSWLGRAPVDGLSGGLMLDAVQALLCRAVLCRMDCLQWRSFLWLSPHRALGRRGWRSA